MLHDILGMHMSYWINDEDMQKFNEIVKVSKINEEVGVTLKLKKIVLILCYELMLDTNLYYMHEVWCDVCSLFLTVLSKDVSSLMFRELFFPKYE